MDVLVFQLEKKYLGKIPVYNSHFRLVSALVNLSVEVHFSEIIKSYSLQIRNTCSLSKCETISKLFFKVMPLS